MGVLDARVKGSLILNGFLQVSRVASAMRSWHLYWETQRKPYRRGRLTHVLDGWCNIFPNYQLYYPS